MSAHYVNEAREAGAVEIYGYGREKELIAKLVLLGCVLHKDGTGKVLGAYNSEVAHTHKNVVLQWWPLSNKWILFVKNLPHGVTGIDFIQYVVRKELVEGYHDLRTPTTG